MGVQLKLPEVARRLGVSEKTARRYVKSGALPSMFVGNAYRVSEEDVERFLQESKVTAGDDSGKASRRSSPEPPLSGIKGERREYDFEAARDGLERFCAYWEQRLADGDISRQEFEDVGTTAETWIPILGVAAAAELNEIIESGRRNPSPTVYGTGSELLSLSEIKKAADRFGKLGSRLAQAEHDMYADAESEKRRAQFRLLEGMRDIA